jgi:hypothetical protein
MARASIERHMQRLGVADSALQPQQMEELVHRLGQGLNVFLGRTRAAEVVEAMRRAVAPAKS